MAIRFQFAALALLLAAAGAVGCAGETAPGGDPGDAEAEPDGGSCQGDCGCAEDCDAGAAASHLAPPPQTGVDQTAELQGWLDGIPDGETGSFPAGAVYQVDGQLELRERSNLTIEGNGAELHRTVLLGDIDPGARVRMNSHVLIVLSQGIAISDLGITGIAAGAYTPDYEAEAAFLVQGSSDVTLTNMQIANVGGDGYELTWYQVPGSMTVGTPSDHITVEGGFVRQPNRMGFSITASSSDVLVHGVSFEDIGRSVYDIEMTSTEALAERVTFDGNTVSAFHLNFFSGGGWGVQREVTVSNNVTPSLRLKVGSPNDVVDRFDYAIVDNQATQSWTPGSFTFLGVDTVTVTGNVWPDGPSNLATYMECEGTITESGNSWN